MTCHTLPCPGLRTFLMPAVMEEGGFAANGLKHCVRPMDMSGALRSVVGGVVRTTLLDSKRWRASSMHMAVAGAQLSFLFTPLLPPPRVRADRRRQERRHDPAAHQPAGAG